MSKKLDGLAHEINVRLQKTDDHRISASLKLAEAKVACKEEGIPFKQWVAANIKNIGYFEATRLAKIGGSPDPVKALEDMRQKTRQSVRKSHGRRVALASATLQLGSPDPDVMSATPVDTCGATVRRFVRQTLQYLPKDEWPELFSYIRAELDDLENKSQEWSFPDGYHPSRQSA